MLRVGITGGIGSGKSTVTDLFQSQGVSVVDTDLVAREVVKPGQPALAQIASRYGNSIIRNDGSLNRRALREKIFANPADKRWLEALLHPEIMALCRQRLQVATSPYTMLSSPLLIESGQYKLVDRILVVDIPEHLQVERATHRDFATALQIQQIIDSQMARTERLKHAHDVLDNSGSVDSLQQAVENLHTLYLKLAQTTP